MVRAANALLGPLGHLSKRSTRVQCRVPVRVNGLQAIQMEPAKISGRHTFMTPDAHRFLSQYRRPVLKFANLEYCTLSGQTHFGSRNKTQFHFLYGRVGTPRSLKRLVMTEAEFNTLAGQFDLGRDLAAAVCEMNREGENLVLMLNAAECFPHSWAQNYFAWRDTNDILPNPSRFPWFISRIDNSNFCYPPYAAVADVMVPGRKLGRHLEMELLGEDQDKKKVKLTSGGGVAYVYGCSSGMLTELEVVKQGETPLFRKDLLRKLFDGTVREVSGEVKTVRFELKSTRGILNLGSAGNDLVLKLAGPAKRPLEIGRIYFVVARAEGDEEVAFEVFTAPDRSVSLGQQSIRREEVLHCEAEEITLIVSADGRNEFPTAKLKRLLRSETAPALKGFITARSTSKPDGVYLFLGAATSLKKRGNKVLVVANAAYRLTREVDYWVEVGRNGELLSCEVFLEDKKTPVGWAELDLGTDAQEWRTSHTVMSLEAFD